jgi:hypothetical protein
MARKISGGISGEPNVSQLQVVPQATIVAASDQDITISPQGNGRLLITANAQLQAQTDLRFADADSSNWVAFQGPATIGSNITWTLPASDGTNLQTLTTNGSGTLTWQTTSVSLTDNNIDSATHFVTLTTATTDTTITAVRRSSAGLTFQPSTGTLTVTAISVGTLTETSSIVYKENINPIENALEKILQLSGFTYDRKDGSRYNEPGLIAEEVEKIIPNVITYKDGRVEGITYTKIIAYLVESIKSLNNEIKEIKGVN